METSGKWCSDQSEPALEGTGGCLRWRNCGCFTSLPSSKSGNHGCHTTRAGKVSLVSNRFPVHPKQKWNFLIIYYHRAGFSRGSHIFSRENLHLFVKLHSRVYLAQPFFLTTFTQLLFFTPKVIIVRDFLAVRNFSHEHCCVKLDSISSQKCIKLVFPTMQLPEEVWLACTNHYKFSALWPKGYHVTT